MSTTWSADSLVPFSAERVQYKHNFLKQVVCELRFPLLPSLGGENPPLPFLTAVRKLYPHTDRANEITMSVGSSCSPSSMAHLFRSVKMDWTVSLKSQAISVETTRYTAYEGLRERVLQIVEAAREVIDSDFFTRVGLRYINVIPTAGSTMQDWVNPQLVGALVGVPFKGVSEHSGKLLLAVEDGGLLLQHGLKPKGAGSAPISETLPMPDYVIDIDTFRAEVALADVGAALDAAHQQSYAMFDWALGPKARALLANKGTQLAN